MASCTTSTGLSSPTDIPPVLNNLITNLSHLSPTDLIHGVGSATISILPIRPSAAISLAHHKLHIFPFKNVPLCWRRLYEEGCLWQIFKRLQRLQTEQNGGADSDANRLRSNDANGERQAGYQVPEDALKEIVRLCDVALILTGAPARRELFDMILAFADLEKDTVKSNTSRIIAGTNESIDGDQSSSDSSSDFEDFDPLPASRPAKRRRLSPTFSPPKTPPTSGCHSTFSSRPAPIPTPCLQHPLPRLTRPSLTQFQKHMHKQATPIILTDTISHWPALHQWPDPQYWLKRTHGGRRLVPIEVGRSYTDDGWGQKIMAFRDFMDEYLVGEKEAGVEASNRATGAVGSKDSNNHPEKKGRLTKETSCKENQPEKQANTGYLAQHDLLTQIPALRNDISIPDYCYTSPPGPTTSQNLPIPHPHPDLDDGDLEVADPSEPLLNLWLGPAHTISPAHTDPHHNILAQVVGRKYVRLFAPSETGKMYPMSFGKGGDGEDTASDATGVDMANTSRVDVGVFVEGENSGGERYREQMERFPHFRSAEYVEGVVGPGECLYIPRGWWHYVRSLEVSCSVSFWWD